MTTETLPDQKQLTKQYQDAIAYLDKHYAYFLTHVLHIGRPIWTQAIQTAAVAMQERTTDSDVRPDDDYDFNFMFSPKFANDLSVEGMAFILAHETLHIVLNHLRLVNDFVDRDRLKELDKARREGKRLSKSEIKELIKGAQAAGKFNIAADCVINDYLVNSGLDASEFYNNPGTPMFTPDVPIGAPMLCRGYDKIGEDAAHLTVHDVYERLEEQAQSGQDKQKGEGGGAPGEGMPGGAGEPGEDMDGRGAQALDSHDWLLDPDFADQMADAIDKLNEEIDEAGKLPQDIVDKKDEEDGQLTQAQQSLQNSMRAGSEAGNEAAFMGGTGAKLGWVKLLKQLDPDMFKEPAIAPPPRAQWNKRPRKLGGVPKINLPVREKARIQRDAFEKPAIVLMLDVSGSIGPRDADRFIELAKSIPQERIKLICATFNTSYSHIPDLQDRSQFNIGGGTDFDTIPNFINDVVKPELKGKYPKAVVVITDGEASLSTGLRPDAKEAEGWYWLISPSDRSNDGSYNASRVIGRRDKLENYVV